MDAQPAPSVIEDSGTEDGSSTDAAQQDAGRDRREGALFVPAVPEGLEADPTLRFRTQTRIERGAGFQLVWTGPEVPPWMPLADGAALLSALDPREDGWLALYRAPSNTRDDRAVAVRYDRAGRVTFRSVLSEAVPGASLEVTDARLDGDAVYFIRACHGYAREEGSRCGYVSAIDVATGAVRWSSSALTARWSIVLLSERFLVVGYAFTGEPASVSVLRKRDGRAMQRLSLTTRGYVSALPGEGPSRTLVSHGSGTIEQRISLSGLDTDRPTLALSGAQTGEPWRGPVMHLGDRDNAGR